MNHIEIIKDQTRRSIWSLKNVINCIADEDWTKLYCEMPFWKHVYHALHSLDMWYINPFRYAEPDFHVANLNNLDIQTEKQLTRANIMAYLERVSDKITAYIDSLSDETLSEKPPDCEYTRFQLILAQHRHLDMHIGMMMGFIIANRGEWPRIMGLQSEFSDTEPLFF